MARPTIKQLQAEIAALQAALRMANAYIAKHAPKPYMVKRTPAMEAAREFAMRTGRSVRVE